MDLGGASSYLHMLHEPKSATIDEVRAIIFDSRSYAKKARKRYFSVPAAVGDKNRSSAAFVTPQIDRSRSNHGSSSSGPIKLL